MMSHPMTTRPGVNPAGSDLPKARVALYSHDTVGMGHMRRNMLIARALAAVHPPPVVLLIAGAREVSSFEIGRAHVLTPVTSASRMPSSA